MKQLLFLLLFPCLAMAQYQGNGNQKITLGEQTSADGLVFRGLASDTTRKPSVDTMAYILLDTNTNIIWQYKKATNNAWTRVGGSISSGVTGVLPVANGGTNTSTAFTQGSVVFAGASGTYTQDNANLFFDNTNNRLGIGTASPATKLDVIGTTRIQNTSTGFAEMLIDIPGAGRQPNFFARVYGQDFVNPPTIFGLNAAGNVFFRSSTNTNPGPKLAIGTDTDSELILGTNDAERMRITSAGEVWIGYTADNGAYPLQVNGQIFATNATIATSDEKFKENITPLNKGLEIINKLKPVTFNFISDTENNFSVYEEVGFIAQDVDRALSTESFAKSIVKAADDSDPTSTMGLATQNLIPVLVKAIQEQQALIKALEQRILILENK